MADRRAVSPHVLVASDIRLLRDGLARALDGDPTIGRVDVTGVTEEMIDRIRALEPDVLVLDASDDRWRDTVRRVAAVAPSLPIVGVSHDGTVGDLVAAIDDAVRARVRSTPTVR